MELYWYWPGDEYDVETTSTPKIEDRRLIEFEPSVQEPESTKRSVVPYAFIRDKLKPVHIDRPWGTLTPETNSGITVNAGNLHQLNRHTGFGWIMYLVIAFDYDGFEIELYRDGEQVFPTVTPNELWYTYGLESGNNIPYITSFDETDDEYIVVYDPPSPLHFENSLWVNVTNPDSANHDIIQWMQTIQINS